METFKRSIRLLFLFMIFGSFFSVADTDAITVKQEEDIGREFMTVIKKRFEIVEDPYVSQYIERLGQRLLKSFPPQPLPYHFYVIKQDVYNAFAGPGGHVFINSGLFQAMATEEELAGILSHEIAHVSCRHISQKIERSSKIELATLAGVAVGIFLGVSGSGGAAANAVTVGSMAAGQSLSLAYSRDDERQADEIGLKYLEKSGYSGHGLITMLKKIKAKQWYGSDIPTYLNTHPAVDDRIAYLDAQLAKAEPIPVSNVATKSDAFDRAHTRLLALYGPKDTAASTFQQMLAEDENSCLANFGMGLFLARDGNRDMAVTYLKNALERQAFDPFLLTDLGRVYYENGAFSAALKTLESAVGLGGQNQEARLLLGRTQTELGQLDDAQKTLFQLTIDRPDFPQGFYYLGDAYHRLEQPAHEHYYLAQFYRLKGDVKKALFNLERAKTHASDSELKEKIETAIKDMKEAGKKSKSKKK